MAITDEEVERIMALLSPTITQVVINISVLPRKVEVEVNGQVLYRGRSMKRANAIYREALGRLHEGCATASAPPPTPPTP